MLWDFQSKLVIADEFPRHLIMNDGCRDYFSGKLIKNGGFLVSVAGRRPGIGEFAWFLAKNSLAMKDSRWGSGMKVARSANAIARKWKSMQILCGSGIFPSLHHRKEGWLRH